MSSTRVRNGLTLVEVIVAMFLLAILGSVLVAALPAITGNTRAASVDSVRSQDVYSVFETVGISWSVLTYFDAETVLVAGEPVAVVSVSGVPGFVSQRTDGACEGQIQNVGSASAPSAVKRLVVTCAEDQGAREWSLRAEFGSPLVAGGE